jgi:hypothetical protein
MKRLLVLVFNLVGMLAFVLTVSAGDIDSTSPPDEPQTLYSTNALYDWLLNGTPPTLAPAFQEPTAGPGPSRKSTKEIYDAFKAELNRCDAEPSQVMEGVTFFSADTGNWGPVTGTGQLAEGTAVAADVLAGKTFSNDTDTGIPGTMPNVDPQHITPGTTNQTITKGYHNGEGWVEGDPDLIAGNIKSGVTIFDVVGDFTSDGTATVDDLLLGTYAYVNGDRVRGNIPDLADDNLKPDRFPYDILRGYYNGDGDVLAPDNFSADNIKDGVTIANVEGTFTEVADDEAAIPAMIIENYIAFVNGQEIKGTMKWWDEAESEGEWYDPEVVPYIFLGPPEGFYDGENSALSVHEDKIAALEEDLVPGNVRSGKTIFGVTGSMDGGVNAPVPQTGQVGCFGGDGTEILCAGTGMDYELRAGVALPSPRFTNNGDGTVTDNLTGLIWLKNANCIGDGGNRTDWRGTLEYVKTLNTNGTMAGNDCGDISNGGTHQTDWRLPNEHELRSIINLNYYEPALSNTAGNGKWTQGDPFDNVEFTSEGYWSSTTYMHPNKNFAWRVNMKIGLSEPKGKIYANWVWPVRGGQ